MNLLRSILLLCVAASAANVALANEFRLMVFGDSLSSGYNLEKNEGWVEDIERAARSAGIPLAVYNESIPGETTAGGLARIPSILEKVKPDLVVVALGANDGLRGLPVAQMEANLLQIFQAIDAQNSRAVHIGIELPRNYGRSYLRAFRAAQDRVAEQTQLPYLPFLLHPIALDESLFQSDGHHPTAEAQPLLAAYVASWLVGVLPDILSNSGHPPRP